MATHGHPANTHHYTDSIYFVKCDLIPKTRAKNVNTIDIVPAASTRQQVCCWSLFALCETEALSDAIQAPSRCHGGKNLQSVTRSAEEQLPSHRVLACTC